MKSMMAMTALGIGEMMGGLFIGQIIDRVGNRAAACANICLITIQTIVVLTFLYLNTYSWLAYFMTFCWGF
jgi:predicted MFS family arabinose efflux permease